MQQAGDGEAAQQRPTLTVSVLHPNNKDDIAKAIDCASACFCGTTTMDGRFISEPLNQCLKMPQSVKAQYLAETLPELAADGLCLIAKDDFGNVIGISFSNLFDPKKMIPTLPPRYASTEQILHFLDPIDREFVHAVEAQTGQQMEANQWVYWSILGVRARVPGANIVDELIAAGVGLANKRKLKGIFGEFTNPKSERAALRNGFVPILNAEGKPIELCYANDPLFKAIDPETATHCKILVKWLEERRSTQE